MRMTPSGWSLPLRVVGAVPPSVEHLIRKEPIGGGPHPRVGAEAEAVEDEQHLSLTAFVRDARLGLPSTEGLARQLGPLEEELARSSYASVVAGHSQIGKSGQTMSRGGVLRPRRRAARP